MEPQQTSDHPSSSSVVMVAEDDAILALDLEEQLLRSGFTVAGPFSTCRAAQDWLRDNTPMVALLDIDLKDGSCEEIAGVLQARGVPFFVCSGALVRDRKPIFRDAPRVQKPIEIGHLMRLLADLRGSSA